MLLGSIELLLFKQDFKWPQPQQSHINLKAHMVSDKELQVILTVQSQIHLNEGTDLKFTKIEQYVSPYLVPEHGTGL